MSNEIFEQEMRRYLESNGYAPGISNVKSISEAVRKADLRLTDILDPNGELVPAQANAFIRLLQKESVLLNGANVQTLRARKQRVNKTRFSTRILRRGVEGQALADADRARPDFDSVEFDTKLFKAEVNWSDEFIEDNLEQDRFNSTLLEMMSAAISRDLEDVVVNGNTASADSFFAAFDGMIAAATSNIHNAAGAVFDQQVANDMINTMPVEFRKRRSEERFILDHNSDQNARNTQATRATPHGDSQLINQGAVNFFGIDLLPVDVWPSNLGIGLNQTAVIETALGNVGVGIWRTITIKREVDNRAGNTSYIASLRADFKYIEERAVVKGINVQSA